MADKSAIEWTDSTWNPVTGCTKVSPGCAHCYAEAITLRFKRGGPYLPGRSEIKTHKERLKLPLSWKTPRRIFVNSMSDLFHDEVPLEFIADVFEVMVKADHHVFQVLTKRHDRLLEVHQELPWPPNVWMGVSVENQYWAERRIPNLIQVPAAIRFLSAEPLLKPLTLGPYLKDIDWVIVGGESGAKARPLEKDWVADIRDDCLANNVHFFFKQWGGKNSKAGGRILEGSNWSELPDPNPSKISSGSSKPTQHFISHPKPAKHDKGIKTLSGEKTLQENTTLGRILPHTEAKHDILTYHLGAWFPILGRSFGRIRFIDGFSGPGQYLGGEPGSPILALNTVEGHRYFTEFAEAGKTIDFLFVEREPRFYTSLDSRIRARNWPSAFNLDVKQGEFEPIINELLDEIDRSRQGIPPTLLFVDPFGSSGFSMGLMARLGTYERIDMLINFNYLDLNRWLPDATKHSTVDVLYGGPRWRPALSLAGDDRKDFLIKEYGQALFDAGWRNTNFEMVNNNNQTQYYLFFGAQHPRGMEVMKQAMRSISPEGLFRYSDRTDPSQPRLIGMGMDEEYAQELATHLFGKYRGQEVKKNPLLKKISLGIRGG